VTQETNMAIELTNEAIRKAIAKREFDYPQDGVLHVFGIRGGVPWADRPPGTTYITEKENKIDEWNDSVGVFGTGFGLWRATVDPGLAYTEDPLNEIGCAHLNDGVWLYQFGLHKGNEALVQADVVTVTRDQDKSGTADKGEYEETGWFGIDLHGGSGDYVGYWSAGCQVIQDSYAYGPNWQSFIQALKRSEQCYFNYYLFEFADLEA